MLRRPPAPPAEESIEQEVISNIQQQAIGRHTLADLHLPEPLLKRIADRIIRSSFEERFRKVVRDAAARGGPQGPAGSPPATRPNDPAAPRAAPDAITTRQTSHPESMVALWKSWPDGRRPINRAFMPALTADDAPNWPLQEPAANDATAPTADLVAQRLAVDGLLPTLAKAIQQLRPASFVAVDEGDLARLRACGLPVDLLRHFSLPDGTTGNAIAERIAVRLQQHAELPAIIVELDHARFQFHQTCAGFRLATDSGENEPSAVCAHMTRAGYWLGEGDGGNADLLRQVAAALPQTPIVASMEDRFASDFAAFVRAWPLTHKNQITILPEPHAIAQWAQDNAKPGWVESDSSGDTGNPPTTARTLAMIVPRFASRGEDGSLFMPGETLATIASASAVGARLIHSPLLFQGGNLLALRDPKTGQRLLLIGEAEIARNTALGLSAEQALEAFRIEFGVDRCVVLPAVSFHIDYDVSVRTVGDHLVALVNDPSVANAIVLREGARALERGGAIDHDTASAALAALERGDDAGFLGRIGPILYGMSASGGFPLSLAQMFSASPVDSDVGNLQRFLLAIDMLISRSLPINDSGLDRHGQSYLHSLQRSEADAGALHAQLAALGIQVVPVPSTSDEARSLNAINGIHLAGLYLMPAAGGLYAPLDQAAADVIGKALGPGVRIVPILCGESERRSGAVRCSLSVFPSLMPR